MKGKIGELKEKLRTNIVLQALPYTLLIFTLTSLGLFGGFAVGKGLSSNIACFVFSSIFTFLGFFLGLLLSYHIVNEKYLVKVYGAE